MELCDSGGDARRHCEICVGNKYVLDKLFALCDTLGAFHVVTVGHIQISHHGHLA